MEFKITFGYSRKKYIYKDFEINIPENKITVLCGHNGAGKTTLLKILSGILPSGIEKQDSWYVSAAGGLIYHFSLSEHLKMMNVSLNLNNDPVCKMAYDLFEAEKYADRKVSSLSTGQMMMASIIVALASGKKILLLDEPFGCLDPTNAGNLTLILREAEKNGVTIVLTSHDLFMTTETADNIVLLKNGTIVCELDVTDNLTVEYLRNTYRELC